MLKRRFRSIYTYVENFETGNIQHTDKMLTFLLGVQSFVTFFHQEFEKSVEHTLGHGAHGVRDLGNEN